MAGSTAKTSEVVAEPNRGSDNFWGHWQMAIGPPLTRSQVVEAIGFESCLSSTVDECAGAENWKSTMACCSASLLLLCTYAVQRGRSSSFRVSSSLKLLAYALVLAHATETTHAAESVEFLRLDCNGQLNIMPKSPFEFTFEMRPFDRVFEAFHEMVTKRGELACPEWDEYEFNNLFSP